MKIHTVVISYQRLELTLRALASYLETVTLPYTLVVVDNGSDADTVERLCASGRLHDFDVFALGENRYPGYACNRGFELAPDGAPLLHRADNDFEFLPGWCDEIVKRFQENPRLGQLGLRTDAEELWNGHNVGGNCVFRRQLWDEGLRWDETPWPEIKVAGYTEDSFMSPQVAARGWEWGRVRKPCIRSISFEDPDDPYYQATWADRGIIR